MQLYSVAKCIASCDCTVKNEEILLDSECGNAEMNEQNFASALFSPFLYSFEFMARKRL